MPGKSTSRRSFLATAAASGLGLGMAGTLPAATAPGGRRRDGKRLMVIGVGGRGRENLSGVQTERIQVLCDIDARILEQAAEKFPDARKCRDYREVLDDPKAVAELDGVVVSTPDHTHYHATMLALQRGLDVYCEKPLTQTIAQARRLLITAQANHCVTQMGTQIHADENYRRVVEAIRAGAIGTVREVIVFVNGTNWSATELPKSAPVPEHVDWPQWLGPAAEREFSPGYHPAGWRRYWEFGGGTTADMACHHVDLPFWALGLDAPTSVLADGPEPHPDCAPAGMRCEYEFPARGDRAAVTLRWFAAKDRPEQELRSRGLEQWRNGTLFLGDDGWLISDYSRHQIGPDARAKEWVAPPKTIASSPGHHREWLDCMADRTQPTCSFAYAVPLTETVLLANVAYRAARGQRIRWDAVAMRTDSDAANELLDLKKVQKGFDA